MSRIPLITDREALDSEGRSAFDGIIESRGTMLRPFEVLLHSPAMAQHVARLGHALRYESLLADADRELVILATGHAQQCRFVWASHLEAAKTAGLTPGALAAIEGTEGALDLRQLTLVDFVRELCGDGTVSERTFEAARAILTDPELVELALTVGYYTMLGYAMGAFEAC